jgi:membrane protein implicated in regulation of membrane protease activity
MRRIVLIAAALVFVAFLLFDTVALLQLGASCATGHCGISVRNLILIAVGIVMLWFVRRFWRHYQEARAAQAKRRRVKRIKPARINADRAPRSRR